MIQGMLVIGLQIFSQNLFLYTRRKIPGCEKEEQYAYFRTLIVVILIAYFAFVLIINILMITFPTLKRSIITFTRGDIIIFYLLLIILLLKLVSTEITRFYIALKQIEINNIGVFIQIAFYSISLIFFGLFCSGLELSHVLILMILSEIIFILYFIKYFDLSEFFKSKWKKDVLTDGYPYGLSLYPVALSSVAINYTDRYLLSLAENLEKVGQYGFAINIVMMVYAVLGSSLILTIFPYATEAQNKNNINERNRLLFINLRYGILLSLMFYVLLVLNREWFVQLIGGLKYEPVKTLFLPLGLYPLFQIINSVASHHLQLNDKTKILAIMYSVYFFVNLSVTYFFIKFFGIMGAAIANILCLSIMSGTSIVAAAHYDVSIKTEIKSKHMRSIGVCSIVIILIAILLDNLAPKSTVLLIVTNLAMIIFAFITIYISDSLTAGEKKVILSLCSFKK